MRTYFWLIIVCPLLTGCFTVTTIDKAKFDRRSERANSILTSYKDNYGNTIVIYTKRGSSHIYRFSQPVDSIITAYRKSQKFQLVNFSAETIFKGVFYTSEINNEPGFQRMLLFDQEFKMKDTAGLMKEISDDSNIAKVLHQKIYIPIYPADNGAGFQLIRSKAVGFILPMDSSNNNSKQRYVIVLQPQRRRYTRYLLLPVTVAVDAITSPFQIIVFGTIWLWGKRPGRG